MADVQLRLVRHLQQGRILSRIEEKWIVVAQALSAADLILFTRQKLLGCAKELLRFLRCLAQAVLLGLESDPCGQGLLETRRVVYGRDQARDE